MSYYILPKNNMNMQIKHTINNEETQLYTSFSVFHYYHKVMSQLLEMTKTEMDISFNNIEKIMNEFHTHEYIFSVVPGTKYSVSKLKTNTNLFYELFEILVTLNCFESFANKPMHFLHIGDNYLDSNMCFDILREQMNDSLCNTPIDKKFDLLFYEIKDEDFTDLNSYVLHFINLLMIIIKNQNENGFAIIKINHVFYKPIVDLIYILSSLFEKTYIVKPNSTNIMNFNKYLVCKRFIVHEQREKNIHAYYERLNDIKKEFYEKKGNIHSIIDGDIPYYFINKIDDINIIIGQQQLEYICQIINIFKNTNKNEKIEIVKKNNIQKSVNWCEKFKIPYNKFLEKTNIFYF